jgi:hypothetical protein
LRNCDHIAVDLINLGGIDGMPEVQRNDVAGALL